MAGRSFGRRCGSGHQDRAAREPGRKKKTDPRSRRSWTKAAPRLSLACFQRSLPVREIQRCGICSDYQWISADAREEETSRHEQGFVPYRVLLIHVLLLFILSFSLSFAYPLAVPPTTTLAKAPMYHCLPPHGADLPAAPAWTLRLDVSVRYAPAVWRRRMGSDSRQRGVVIREVRHLAM